MSTSTQRTESVPARTLSDGPGRSPLRRWGAEAVLGLVAVALLLPPVVIGDTPLLAFLVLVLILAPVAVGLQFVLGNAGLLSLGHAAFFGLGAYTSALAMMELNLPYPLALVAAIAVAVLGALLMAPIIRLPPVYFAMASFAFGIVIFELFNQWGSLTGGNNGLIGVPAVALAGLEVTSTPGYYYVAWVLFVLVFALFWGLLRSPVGQALAAVRQAEDGARSIGVRIPRSKVFALVVAAAAAGAAGSVYASYYITISPSTFGPGESVALLAMVVVGGKRDPWGAVIGAFVIEYLVSYGSGIAEYQILVYGALLTILMVLLPGGISGFLRSVLARSRPRQGEEAALDA